MSSNPHSTQRDRLIDAMIEVVAREGYARLSVTEVIKAAGVSRTTFYAHFRDKEDCFAVALREVSDALLREIRQGVDRVDGEHALAAAMQGLLRFVDAHGEQAQALVSQSMAAGGQAREIRDRCLTEAERVIEAAWAELPADTQIPDLSSRMMLGAIFRMLAIRLQRGETDTTALLEDLTSWSSSYTRPIEQHRWRTLQPLALDPAPVDFPPPRFPVQGGPAVEQPPRDAAQEVERLRILIAVANTVERKGYSATNVSEISKAARLDARAFYRHFTDKQSAFSTVLELYYQQVMAVSASAFVTTESWPRRVWDAVRASARYIEEHRNLAYVGFIESYAAGPEALGRTRESMMAFTLFLAEGYRYEERPPPPALLSEVIALTSAEIAYSQVSASSHPHLSGLAGHVTWLALAPFMGPDRASEFVLEQVSREKINGGGAIESRPCHIPQRSL